MFKKILAILTALAMLLSLTAAFAESEAHNPVTISYYSTQAGVDEETADREACELEHAISPESFCLLRSSLEARLEWTSSGT